MSTAFNSHSPPIQPARIRYYEDQVLAASDLKDDRSHADWLRRLHLRVLHDTWGIALGYDILPTHKATHLLVTPGLAYDGWGREVALVDALQIPIPQNLPAEGLVLSIRYNETLGIDAQERAACVPSKGPNPEQERPEFSWQSPKQLRMGAEIPLVLVRWQKNQIVLDLSIRRYAETLQRPYIGSDSFTVTIANEQELAPYLWTIADSNEPVGLRFTIDTAACGFIQIPSYFASFTFVTNVSNFDLILSQSFQSITHPAPDHFTFQILFLPGAQRGEIRSIVAHRQINSLQILISWLGIEPIAGQETSLDQNQVFSWAGTRLSDWQMSGLTQFMTGHADYHADYATGGGA